MQITKLLTALRWYAAPLTLASSALAGNVRLIRKINAAGNGYSSFNPASNFNSLTVATTGDDLIVEAKPSAITGVGFTINNGSLPVLQRLSFPSDATGYPFPIVIAAGEAGTYVLDPATPQSGLTSISYAKTPAGGVSAGATLPVTLGVGDTLTVTATTGVGTPGFLALITQQ